MVASFKEPSTEAAEMPTLPSIVSTEEFVR
jgi:hypothetical protein